jgi:hypothetical protein
MRRVEIHKMIHTLPYYPFFSDGLLGKFTFFVFLAHYFLLLQTRPIGCCPHTLEYLEEKRFLIEGSSARKRIDIKSKIKGVKRMASNFHHLAGGIIINIDKVLLAHAIGHKNTFLRIDPRHRCCSCWNLPIRTNANGFGPRPSRSGSPCKTKRAAHHMHHSSNFLIIQIPFPFSNLEQGC